MNEAEAMSPCLREWRRHLHEHPELSYKEYETTAFIASALKDLGYEHIRTGFGDLRTGVLAELNPENTGPGVALRADIDALPILEESDLSFSSRKEGVMHACGHDAHVAMLLGAAGLLKRVRDRLPGRVRLIFQPGEETARMEGEKAYSAAEFVIRSGALQGVNAVFALHVWAHLDAGTVGYALGPAMYASCRFYLTVLGRGGHGAAPHEAIDPIPTACEVVDAWQKIVSREVDARETALITTGIIRGGTAPNVIPDRVELAGTIRGLSREVIEYVCRRMGEIAEHVCAAHRCRADFRSPKSLRSVVNHRELSLLAASVAEEVLGKKRCLEIKPITGSDDYAYYGEVCPAAYFFLGMRERAEGEGGDETREGKEDKYACAHHNAKFAVNDGVLPLGAALLAGVAESFLERAVSGTSFPN
jgi:amidohydrolase